MLGWRLYTPISLKFLKGDNHYVLIIEYFPLLAIEYRVPQNDGLGILKKEKGNIYLIQNSILLQEIIFAILFCYYHYFLFKDYIQMLILTIYTP